MTPEQAKSALILLERITLSPSEIQAYAEIRLALQTLANPQPEFVEDD